MAPMAGASLWDYQGYSLVEGPVRLAREVGALDSLPMLLNQMADAAVWRGDLAVAASLIAEADAICEATGARIPPYAALMLASYRGREAEATRLIQATIEQADAVGQGAAVTWAHWAAMRLYNGMGRYADVVATFQQVSDRAPVHSVIRPLTELIEAATRTGDLDMARDALGRLAEWTRVGGGTDWALAIETRCRALLADGGAAEDLYRETIERFSHTRLRPSLARACLLYGEWLRREGRRLDAREQLRTAHHLFDAIGMEAFAERARRELLATGETARKRSPETREELTPQEEQIARLARDGLSNPEIGAQLFVSARTVEWHLRNVFAKFGITSRRQLQTALPEDGRLAGMRA
jgi:DNA-binding CsgD family transcriptional regulator